MASWVITHMVLWIYFPWKSHPIPSTWPTPASLSNSITSTILFPQSVLEIRYTSQRMPPYPVPTTCITAFITSDCYCQILLAPWIPWSKDCLFYSISMECDTIPDIADGQKYLISEWFTFINPLLKYRLLQGFKRAKVYRLDNLHQI